MQGWVPTISPKPACRVRHLTRIILQFLNLGGRKRDCRAAEGSFVAGTAHAVTIVTEFGTGTSSREALCAKPIPHHS